MENNQQEIPVDCLIQIAKNFGMSVDDVIFFDEKNGVPNEVSMNDKAALEQLQLINELNEEEKGILLKLIETFVSKKRFKDYLQKYCCPIKQKPGSCRAFLLFSFQDIFSQNQNFSV